MPQTPSWTEPSGLIARLVTGGLSGACVIAAGGGAVLLGGLLGAAGGGAGCFLGYHARRSLVRAANTRDIYIAVLEDILTLAGSLWVVLRL
jgi:uncharacterized membrane protein